MIVTEVERAEACHKIEVGPLRLIEQLRPLSPDERARQSGRAAHADQDGVDVPAVPLSRVFGQTGKVDTLSASLLAGTLYRLWAASS